MSWLKNVNSFSEDVTTYLYWAYVNCYNDHPSRKEIKSKSWGCRWTWLLRLSTYQILLFLLVLTGSLPGLLTRSLTTKANCKTFVIFTALGTRNSRDKKTLFGCNHVELDLSWS